MPKLNVLTQASAGEVPMIAVAIGGVAISGREDQRHVGILFQSEDKGLQIIHQGWHLQFHCESPTAGYFWIPIENVNLTVLTTFADWLEVFYATHGDRLPYSIAPFDESPFDSSGKLRALVPGEGFTCATFVLWAFHALKIPLIAGETWKPRPDDKKWKAAIISMLQNYEPSVDQAHIDAQMTSIEHASRFRPEEVAGAAAAYEGRPYQFEEAADLAKDIWNGLNQYGAIARGEHGEKCLIGGAQ